MCLVFIAPILIVYEIGVISLGTQASRNGIDVLFRHTLEQIGFGFYFLLPVLTSIILLSWHHLSGQRWHLNKRTLWVMFFESTLLAFALLLVANLQYEFFSGQLLNVSQESPVAAVGAEQLKERLVKREIGQLIGYFGAGIYEEFLFRLILLPVSIVIFAWVGLPKKLSLALAVALTSFLFASAHYQPLNPAGFPMELGDSSFIYTFCFRSIASVFFCCLFLFRGFGIVVGVHAFYDLLTHVM